MAINKKMFGAELVTFRLVAHSSHMQDGMLSEMN
jgi:hypothetical protein